MDSIVTAARAKAVLGCLICGETPELMGNLYCKKCKIPKCSNCGEHKAWVPANSTLCLSCMQLQEPTMFMRLYQQASALIAPCTSSITTATSSSSSSSVAAPPTCNCKCGCRKATKPNKNNSAVYNKMCPTCHRDHRD